MASSTLTTHAVVDVGDIQVLSQKCDRVEAGLDRKAIGFAEFIADVKVLVMAARILTSEHLPPSETPAKEI
jgi:hypothetical protein